MRSTLDEWLTDLKDGRKETTACNEATETKLDPGLMQSIEEHQDIPKKEAAVIPIGGPRKRRRVCNLAAERRQKRKERTRGKSGSRTKFTACRNVSRRAKVAWRKRNLFRNVRTLEKCGQGRPAVQKWHGARDAIMKGRRSNRDDGRIRLRIKLQEESE
jgi:hypothetical protein